tara:strand:+ start:571 stop:711 length:141 start_codon:yes stop_codon:yes gene_type:complete
MSDNITYKKENIKNLLLGSSLSVLIGVILGALTCSYNVLKLKELFQ